MWCRANYKATEDHLLKLGATRVMTYDDLEDKRIREKIKSLTLGKVCSVLHSSGTVLIISQEIRLGLNCVGVWFPVSW
jgi:hypothetical protein